MKWSLCSVTLLEILLVGLCSCTGSISTVQEAVTSQVSFLSGEEFSSQEQQQQQEHPLIRVGKNSSTCWHHDNCYDCTEASRCHWCQHDNKCHVVGSVYGCLTGMNCDKKKSDDNNDKPVPDSCAAYTTCSQCAMYRTCHWCAHDDSCHTVGSVYGCLRGVDCYSNDRCRRDTPEPLPPDNDHFTHMGFVPLFLVALLGTGAFLCASFCLCCACGVKGAYQDLCFAASSHHHRGQQQQQQQQQQDLNNNHNHNVHDGGMANPARPSANSNLTEALLSDALAETENTTTDQVDKTNAAAVERPSEQQRIEEGETYYQAMSEEHGVEESPLLPAVATAPEPTTIAQSSFRRSSSSRHYESKHVRRMMNACTGIYIATVLVIGGIMFGAMRLFPKIPEYSVCNDSVAWSKLISHMTSLDVEVDFEILMSFSNENNFDVALDMGRGIFKHGGANIGHFTIPPVQAPSMAITDIMIIATLAPEKWEAMSLTAEYYEGKLVLDVDAELNVRAPSLFNFSKEIAIAGKKVYINKQADRHLCACKKWDNNSTKHNHHHRDEGWGLLEWDFDFDVDVDSTVSTDRALN